MASGLITAADLDAAEAAVREAGGGTAAEAATAQTLVDQGKLTAFQAREMLAGRTRFRLGQYTVIDEIGRGGMGQVFRAEHALMGRHVAVKVLPRAKATPESEAAFRREMRILGRLDHENLVRAFDAGYDAMVYYLVTELVPGIDLRRHVRKYGPLDEVGVASVFTQVARALAFAHAERLVHRDVKPGNILVMDDGRVKLLDLGLAGSALEAEAVRLGRVVGTMDYIAPEQIRTPDDVGPPADIYSLGCSMYFALTGEVPFPGGSRKDKMRRHLTETPPPIQRLAPQVAQPLCHVVESLMAKSVADRVGSADEVIRLLARWTSDKPTPLPRSPRGDIAPAAVPPGGQEPADAEADSSVGAPVPTWPVLEERVSLEEPLVIDDSRRRPGGSGDDESLAALLSEALSMVRSVPVLGTLLTILVPAAIAGGGVTIATSVVRGGDVDRFERVLGAVTPAMCGWAAFLLVATVRAATRVGRQHR